MEKLFTLDSVYYERFDEYFDNYLIKNGSKFVEIFNEILPEVEELEIFIKKQIQIPITIDLLRELYYTDNILFFYIFKILVFLDVELFFDKIHLYNTGIKDYLNENPDDEEEYFNNFGYMNDRSLFVFRTKNKISFVEYSEHDSFSLNEFEILNVIDITNKNIEQIIDNYIKKL